MTHPRLRQSIVILLALAVIAGMPILQPATEANAAGLWVYTALGDSLAFGAFALPLRGYTYLYRQAAAFDTGTGVWLSNLGVPGWNAPDLLNALRTNWLFRTSVRNSRIVTWNIGGNDLRAARSRYKAGTCGGADNQDCMRQAVHEFKLNWDAILTELDALLDFNRTIVRTMDIYNPYVREDQAADSWPADAANDFQVLKFYLDDANAYIAATSTAAGIPYAPVYYVFNGPTGDEDPVSKGYIAFDNLHMSGLGHAVTAALLRSLGYAPLR